MGSGLPRCIVTSVRCGNGFGHRARIWALMAEGKGLRVAICAETNGCAKRCTGIVLVEVYSEEARNVQS